MQLVSSVSGVVHIASAVAALLLGLCVFALPKGTRLHRRIGYGFVLAMVTLNVTAFLIQRLFGGFGPFHVAAAISAVTLAAGFIPVFTRRPRDRWLEMHFEFMSWSYVGLLAAGAAEVAVRVPESPFWGTVAGSSIAVAVLGGIIIARTRSRFIK